MRVTREGRSVPKSGWDQKLEIAVSPRMNDVASAMQAGYDKSGIGRITGKLRRALGTLGNYRLLKRDIRITIPLAYARIEDTGGRIPARHAKNGKKMHYFAYGQEWFLSEVEGFTLPGFHYIEAGAREIEARFNSGKEILGVRWKYSKAERAAYIG